MVKSIQPSWAFTESGVLVSRVSGRGDGVCSFWSRQISLQSELSVTTSERGVTTENELILLGGVATLDTELVSYGNAPEPAMLPSCATEMRDCGREKREREDPADDVGAYWRFDQPLIGGSGADDESMLGAATHCWGGSDLADERLPVLAGNCCNGSGGVAAGVIIILGVVIPGVVQFELTGARMNDNDEGD